MYAEQLEATSTVAPTQEPSAKRPYGSSSYRPQTPFLIDPAYQQTEEAQFGQSSALSDAVTNAVGATNVVETPFITEYELEGRETESYEMSLHRELMEELYDEEFVEAVEDLVNDVRGVYENQFAGELEHDSAEAERQLSFYLMPLENEVTAAIDKMIEELMPIDNEELDEAQLDNFLENFEYRTELEQPAFEEFFGKIFKKIKKIAKKVVKKGIRVIKKVGKVLKKFSPIHIILGKLKKLVRPLLRRVLKFALNKIPARFRPLARRLSRRFLKGALGELPDGEFDSEYFSIEDEIEQAEMMANDNESASPSPRIITSEFDAILAGYIIEGEDFDYEPALNAYINEEDFEDEGAAYALDNARDRFVHEIVSAETEEEAAARIEQFIPAILAGLRIGIRIIGRRRVVNFLAKLVAKLIKRFVGRRAAVPLSRALVDAGLKLVSLENPEEAEHEAGQVIAKTVEETIDEFVTTAPAEAMEDEELMEVYVQEAFEHAVARNFPPTLVRRKLRHCSSSKGTWIMRPRGRRRKRYKRFTQRFNVTITPQMATRIRSFGGQTLHSFLKEQLGLPIDTQNVSARMHLFEGIRGTSLSDISHLEKRIEGLGSRSRSAWSKIHPLTRGAAALLIPKNVGLARRISRRFLERRTRLGVGQRFYYLEIAGARTVRASAKSPEKIGSRKQSKPRAAKASEVNMVIDFNSREIRIYDFFSEAAATELAQSLRRGRGRAAFVKAINSSLTSALRRILTGSSGTHLKMKREMPAEEAFVAGMGPILRFVGRVVSGKLQSFVLQNMLVQMKASGDAMSKEFIKAADSAEDGVTLVLILSQIGEVFAVFEKNPLKRVKALQKLQSSAISGGMKISIRPGFHRQ